MFLLTAAGLGILLAGLMPPPESLGAYPQSPGVPSILQAVALLPPDQLVPWRASWRILGGVWHWIAFVVEYRLPVVAAGVGAGAGVDRLACPWRCWP